MYNHTPGAVYGISLGQAALPGTRIGSRLVGIVLGVLTVAVAAALAGAMAGPTAAVWAAALVAFNEDHIGVSAKAVELVYYVTFGMLALYAFWRFLETDRDKWLYAAALSLGVAYFCQEIAALLGPVMLLALVRRDGLRWLWRRRSWVAAAIVALFVIPDYLTVLGDAPTSAVLPTDHLSRINGLGLRYHPTLFYLYDLVQWAFAKLGRDFFDAGAGYPHTNLLAGVVLLGGVFWALFIARVWKSHLGWLLCAVFIVVFGVFTVLETDGGTRGLDPIGWQWIDLTLVPAAVLTGTWLATSVGVWRYLTWTAAGLAVAIAAVQVTTNRLEQPALAAAACPEHIVATGALQDVRILLGSCDACVTPAAVIDSVQILGARSVLRPARPDEYEILSGDGTTPRLRLRTLSESGETWGGWPAPWTADEPARRYLVRLRTTPPAEAPSWQRASEPEAIEVDVFIMPRPYEPEYRPVFGCTAGGG